MRISLIVAIADNGVIGAENALPWRLPNDLRRFKRFTMGHHLLIGRRTFDSIGRPLPGRRMLVLTRGEPRLPDGVGAVGSLEEALAIAGTAGDEEPFVAGGGEIYGLALPQSDRIYLTRVHTEPDGDVRFPPVNWQAWRLRFRQEHRQDERHSAAHTFEIYDRRSSGVTDAQGA